MTFAKEKERRPDHFLPLKTLEIPSSRFYNHHRSALYITFALPAPPRAPLTRTFLLCDWICFRNHALRVLSQPHSQKDCQQSFALHPDWRLNVFRFSIPPRWRASLLLENPSFDHFWGR